MRHGLTALSFAIVSGYAGAATQVELDGMRDKAVAWLVRAQQDDGRWTSAAGLDVQATSAAIEALKAAGYSRLPAFASAVAWLQNAEANSVDALARQVSALWAAGSHESVRRLAPALLDWRSSEGGGWGAYAGYSESNPDTPLSLLALNAASVPIDGITDIGNRLANNRASSGGISQWYYTLATSTVTVELHPGVVPTAYAIKALQAYGLAPIAVAEGAAYLRASQAPSGTNMGGFLNNGAATYLIWEAAIASEAIERTSASGRADPAVQLALDFLKGKQAANGSWGNDAFSTATALKHVGSSSAEPLDTDGDGVPDPLERILGTDVNIADSKGTAPHGDSASDEFHAYRALRSQPTVIALPLGTLQQCCEILGGKLPDGLSLSSSASPLKATIAGTPTQDGIFDLEFSYKNSTGQTLRAFVSIEVVSRLFRIDTDPVSMSALLADPALQRLSSGTQFLADDFNQDGTVDLLGYLNGANELFNQPGCDPCAAYDGPNWGVVIGAHRSGARYVTSASLLSDATMNGDLRSLHGIDYNNDGRLDLLLVLNPANTTSTDPQDTTLKPFRSLVLLRNDSTIGGELTFTDVTTSIGLDVAPQGDVAIVDANRDGAPDIVMSNGSSAGKLYQFNKTTGVFNDKTSTAGLGPLKLPVAVNFDRSTNNTLDIVTLHDIDGLRLYRNNGSGTFTLVQNATPLTSFAGRRINRIIPTDLNGDLWPELVFFESATVGSGSTEVFSGSIVRVLNHGGLVSNVPQFSELPASILTTASGSVLESNLGGSVADVDADGLPDIVVASRDISAEDVSSVVFKQQNDRSFVRLTTETGFPAGVIAFDSPIAVDLNGDAKVDLIFPNSSNTAYRLTNEGGPSHALTVVLRGKATARQALGARVTVTAGGIQQEQQLLAGHATSSRLSFGLGHATSASVAVRWPDGTTQTIETTDVDRVLTITQP